MPDLSGSRLGKVQVGELIARGGMAEVYLGEHTTLRRKVAVKIMRGTVDQDPETVARFQREAHVVASLRHPNIVQLFDYELADGQPCLIMEYVSGPTLSNYLKALHQRGEKLPLATVNRLLHALAEALDYAHSQHIVHRDIKPANVLLRSASDSIDLDQPLPDDVEPILTDFGLVRLLDSSIQTSTGTVSGTPTYMSPEQARGDKVGSFTDIYSLGVMLYEMLAGTVPFEADSTFGVLMKHLNDPPPPIFGISSDLQAVIDRTLAKDPGLRFNSAKELANEFNAIFNGDTISSGTRKLAQLARKSVPALRSTPWNSLGWIVGIGALVIAGIAFAAFRLFPGFLAPGRDPNQPLGRVTYADFNYVVDKVDISVAGLPPPGAGTHYEIWYLGGGGEERQNIGRMNVDDTGHGQLAFIDPEQRNLLEVFDQLEVTEEADDDPNPDEPSGEVVASFIYPPLSFVHIRHLIVKFDSAPDETSLIYGLWATADGIDTSMFELQEAFADQDEALVRQKTEEVINQLVGKSDAARYRDWDGDGTLADPGDGFGLLANGYLSETVSHTNFAMQAPDATENINLQGGKVLVCLDNMSGWSEQLLEKALILEEMPFGPTMEPLIAEMVTLAMNNVSGIDANSNSLIEPIAGEGGAATAYEYAYYMADMLLLPGAGQIPPPAPKE
jgi:serine/threonine protein kinase